MNIIFIGPQGSGKGTQARILSDKFGFFYFESGAYLRRIAEKNPELKKSLAAGNLVPDREMTSYFAAFLDEKDLYDNIILDGFPRTVGQYHFFKKWLDERGVKLDLTIVLNISEKETVRRLSARVQDSSTHKIYNLLTDPPPAGIERSHLVQREDDKPEAIKKRLELYREMTEPLISELRQDSEVIEINGERPIDAIAEELETIIEKRQASK